MTPRQSILMEIAAHSLALRLAKDKLKAFDKELIKVEESPHLVYCHGNDNRRLRMGDDEAH